MIILGCSLGALANFWIFALSGDTTNLIVGLACTSAAVGALIFEMS